MKTVGKSLKVLEKKSLNFTQIVCMNLEMSVSFRPEKITENGPLYKRLVIGCMSCDSSNCKFKSLHDG